MHVSVGGRLTEVKGRSLALAVGVAAQRLYTGLEAGGVVATGTLNLRLEVRCDMG